MSLLCRRIAGVIWRLKVDLLIIDWAWLWQCSLRAIALKDNSCDQNLNLDSNLSQAASLGKSIAIRARPDILRVGRLHN